MYVFSLQCHRASKFKVCFLFEETCVEIEITCSLFFQLQENKEPGIVVTYVESKFCELRLERFTCSICLMAQRTVYF